MSQSVATLPNSLPASDGFDWRAGVFGLGRDLVQGVAAYHVSRNTQVPSTAPATTTERTHDSANLTQLREGNPQQAPASNTPLMIAGGVVLALIVLVVAVLAFRRKG